MKVVRVINVVVQSLVIIAGIVAALFNYFQEDPAYGSYRRDDELMIIFFVTETLLGVYQLLHAFITSILKLVHRTFSWLLGIYWIVVVVIFLVWFSFLFLGNLNAFDEDVFVCIVSLGWIPIIFYLIISAIDLKKAFKA